MIGLNQEDLASIPQKFFDSLFEDIKRPVLRSNEKRSCMEITSVLLLYFYIKYSLFSVTPVDQFFKLPYKGFQPFLVRFIKAAQQR